MSGPGFKPESGGSLSHLQSPITLRPSRNEEAEDQDVVHVGIRSGLRCIYYDDRTVTGLSLPEKVQSGLCTFLADHSFDLGGRRRTAPRISWVQHR